MVGTASVWVLLPWKSRSSHVRVMLKSVGSGRPQLPVLSWPSSTHMFPILLVGHEFLWNSTSHMVDILILEVKLIWRWVNSGLQAVIYLAWFLSQSLFPGRYFFWASNLKYAGHLAFSSEVHFVWNWAGHMCDAHLCQQECLCLYSFWSKTEPYPRHASFLDTDLLSRACFRTSGIHEVNYREAALADFMHVFGLDFAICSPYTFGDMDSVSHAFFWTRDIHVMHFWEAACYLDM